MYYHLPFIQFKLFMHLCSGTIKFGGVYIVRNTQQTVKTILDFMKFAMVMLSNLTIPSCSTAHVKLTWAI